MGGNGGQQTTECDFFKPRKTVKCISRETLGGIANIKIYKIVAPLERMVITRLTGAIIGGLSTTVIVIDNILRIPIHRRKRYAVRKSIVPYLVHRLRDRYALQT